jgi:hypothetical protein
MLRGILECLGFLEDKNMLNPKLFIGLQAKVGDSLPAGFALGTRNNSQADVLLRNHLWLRYFVGGLLPCMNSLTHYFWQKMDKSLDARLIADCTLKLTIRQHINFWQFLDYFHVFEKNPPLTLFEAFFVDIQMLFVSQLWQKNLDKGAMLVQQHEDEIKAIAAHIDYINEASLNPFKPATAGFLKKAISHLVTAASGSVQRHLRMWPPIFWRTATQFCSSPSSPFFVDEDNGAAGEVAVGEALSLPTDKEVIGGMLFDANSNAPDKLKQVFQHLKMDLEVFKKLPR